jgi:hypothetical protein
MGDGCRLNNEAYVNLIKEDLGWLLEQKRTLERDHIELILAEKISELSPKELLIDLFNTRELMNVQGQ